MEAVNERTREAMQSLPYSKSSYSYLSVSNRPSISGLKLTEMSWAMSNRLCSA